MNKGLLYGFLVAVAFALAIAIWALGILWVCNDFVVPHLSSVSSITFWQALIPATVIVLFRRNPEATENLKKLKEEIEKL